MKFRSVVFLIWVALLFITLVRREGADSDSVTGNPNPATVARSPDLVDDDERPAALSLEPAVVQTSDDEESGGVNAPARWWGLDGLVRIARMQNEDGSWGTGLERLGDHYVDRTGLTGLVLFAFFSQGYSHLSKDEYDGVRFGTTVKDALKWFVRQQSATGTFATIGTPDLNHILATLALSEAYGMTATQLFKEPAQRAVNALVRNFMYRSGWGDDSTAAWAALATSSARSSELDVDESFLALNRFMLEDGAGAEHRTFRTAGWSLLQDGGPVRGARPEAARLLRNPADLGDLERAYFEAALVVRGGYPVGLDQCRERREAIAHLGRTENAQEFIWPGGFALRMSLLLAALEAHWRFRP